MKVDAEEVKEIEDLKSLLQQMDQQKKREGEEQIQEIEKRDKKIQTMEKQIQNMEEQIQEKDQQIEEKDQQIEKKDQQIEEKEKRTQELEERTQELEKKLRDVQTLNRTHIIDMAKRSMELEGSRSENSSLKDEIARKSKMAEDLEAKKSLTDTELKKSRSKLNTIMAHAEKGKRKHGKLTSDEHREIYIDILKTINDTAEPIASPVEESASRENIASPSDSKLNTKISLNSPSTESVASVASVSKPEVNTNACSKKPSPHDQTQKSDKFNNKKKPSNYNTNSKAQRDQPKSGPTHASMYHRTHTSKKI